MTTRLFGRRARITVGSVRVDFDGDRGLRMSFSVDRSIPAVQPIPSPARAVLYNLSGATRARLRDRESPIIIEAGYEGLMAQVFYGASAVVYHARESTEWMTTIETKDGLGISTARSNRSMAPGTSIKQALQDLAKDMDGNGKAVIDRLAKGDLPGVLKVLANGVSLSGRSADRFSELAKAAGLQWSIESEQVKVRAADEALDANAIVLSSSTGLIGSPTKVFDPFRLGAQGKVLIQGKALMNPHIEPNRRLRLRSDAISGDFRCLKVTHAGDTHGGAGGWTTSFEAASV